MNLSDPSVLGGGLAGGASSPANPPTRSRPDAELQIAEEAQVATIVLRAEKAMLESPLYAFMRLVLLGVLLLGVVLWAGGAIYSGVQIASIQQQSEQTLSKLTKIEARVSGADAEIRKLLDEKVEKVDKFATKSQDEIRQTRDVSAKNIQEAASKVLQDINEEKKRAIEKLDVGALPDLRQLRETVGELRREITSLQVSGGRLNVGAIHELVGLSWWILMIATLGSAIAAVSLFIWPRKR